MVSPPDHEFELRKNFGSNASRSEPSLAPRGGIKIEHLHDLRRHDALDDQLSDPVPGLHLKIQIRVVEQQDADRAPVVRVDHPRPDVDRVLPRQPGSRSCVIQSTTILLFMRHFIKHIKRNSSEGSNSSKENERTGTHRCERTSRPGSKC